MVARSLLEKSDGLRRKGDQALRRITCDAEEYMTGLIVKGSTALFLAGNDPGAQDAVALVNRVRGGNSRSCETKLGALKLERVARPVPLSRETIGWAYVFVALTEGDERRLEPGPFDAELTTMITSIEAQQHAQTTPREAV
jgi:hypothetical protein